MWLIYSMSSLTKSNSCTNRSINMTWHDMTIWSSHHLTSGKTGYSGKPFTFEKKGKDRRKKKRILSEEALFREPPGQSTGDQWAINGWSTGGRCWIHNPGKYQWRENKRGLCRNKESIRWSTWRVRGSFTWHLHRNPGLLVPMGGFNGLGIGSAWAEATHMGTMTDNRLWERRIECWANWNGY